MCIWLFIGLLSTMFLYMLDMRGNPYKEDYFEGEIGQTIKFILMGGFMPVLVVFVVLQEQYEKRKKNRNFTKFIYKLANIGVKKNEEKE